MEVSALKYPGALGLHARSPLLRIQSDERLVAFTRRGNVAAFEVLVSRYESRLLAFCRHLLGSREDAEDVLQEVLAAAFNAMLADDRPIKVRPWLYRIARNRSLNHLRRNQAIGVDSMDVHFSENGASTADKVHEREEFRLLVGDIHELPETQRTALVLREMDALSYEQIADAMETTVPSVKSLLVRARVSLAEAAEARLLSCDQVRLELGEVAEGLKRRPSPLVRRHLRSCDRCSAFRVQLKETNKALAALLPFGPFIVLKKLALTHLGHSAGSSAAGSGAAGSGAGAAGSGAAAGAAGSTAAGSSAMAGSAFVAGSGAGGLVSAGVGAVATKAVAGLAAAALVTAGAVEVDGSTRHGLRHAQASVVPVAPSIPDARPATTHRLAASHHSAKHKVIETTKSDKTKETLLASTATATKPPAKVPPKTHAGKLPATPTPVPPAGQTVVTTDPTHLAQGNQGKCPSTGTTTTTGSATATGGSVDTAACTITQTPTTTPTGTVPSGTVSGTGETGTTPGTGTTSGTGTSPGASTTPGTGTTGGTGGPRCIGGTGCTGGTGGADGPDGPDGPGGPGGPGGPVGPPSP